MAFWNKKNKPGKEVDAQEKLVEKIESLEKEVATIKDEIPITDSQAFKEMFIDGIPGGTRVLSQDVAMKCSAVFACVRLIAGAASSAEVLIQKVDAEGKPKRVKNHPYANMLRLKPNPFITASTFWKVMVLNKILSGNAYSPIIRSRSGRPLGLMPLRATRVYPMQAWMLHLDEKLGVDKYRLYYQTYWDDGTYSLIDQDDMIHVPNIGWNGRVGMSTISAGAQAMGLSLSAEESAAAMFTNGMVNDIAITYPKKMDDDIMKRLRANIAERHSGATNHHKPLTLTEGGDVKVLNMNANDAQLLQSRQFSVIDLCRFFGVPPVMIGESEKTSSWGSGVEQMARWFVMFTMNDHYTDFEQELEKKLFLNSNYRAKFDEKQLLRGDTQSRAQYYKAAIGGTQNPAWMTPNEVRVEEGMEEREDGDELFKPTSTNSNPQQPQKPQPPQPPQRQ